jgi:precorrin-8X/cobalt-precorrin-8 methylmutase
MNNVNERLEPGEIEKRSFAIIDAETPAPRPFEGKQWRVVRRMIHTTADFEMLSLVRFHTDAVSKGMAALRNGCLVVTDTEMARRGIPKRRMAPLGCRVECHMTDAAVKEQALKDGTTRALAAVDAVRHRLDGGIYVVGNAPTALLRLLKWMDRGECNPALVVGMPVGFVNAAESKALLMEQKTIPYIAVAGRKGGSALAACVVNQLAEFVLEER